MKHVRSILVIWAATAACSSSPYDSARYGLVTIAQTNAAMPATTATASFTLQPWFEYSYLGCNLIGSRPDGYGAGEIDITGTTSPVTLVEQGSTPHVSYAARGAVPNPLFVPGAQLTVHAQGGEVPAFTASPIVPAPIAGWTPPTVLSRSGYRTTWTADNNRPMYGSTYVRIVVVAFQSSNQANVAELDCIEDDVGMGGVADSEFALIPAQYDQALIEIGRVNMWEDHVGEVSIQVDADIATRVGPLTLGP